MSILAVDLIKPRTTGVAVTVSGDLDITGALAVTGDITYDEVAGRNLDISGIATIATLGVSAATTSKDLDVSGVTTTGSLYVSGITTVGILTSYATVTVGTAITADATSGIITATDFVGGGSQLTGLPAGFTELDAMLFN